MKRTTGTEYAFPYPALWTGLLGGLFLGASFFAGRDATLFALPAFPLLFHALSRAGRRAVRVLTPSVFLLSAAASLAFGLPAYLGAIQATFFLFSLLELFAEGDGRG